MNNLYDFLYIYDFNTKNNDFNFFQKINFTMLNKDFYCMKINISNYINIYNRD